MKNIVITESQVGALIDHVEMSMETYNERINALTEEAEWNQFAQLHNPDLLDGLPDLMEAHEQASRLRNLLIALVGGGRVPVWTCPDNDCRWLTLVEEDACEQCGTPKQD